MYWDIWVIFGFLNICDFLRVPWGQMKSENLRNSKIVLHFLTGASKLELLASKHNQAFFWDTCILSIIFVFTEAWRKLLLNN